MSSIAVQPPMSTYCPCAGPIGTDVDILVPPDVHSEHVRDLQTAPGAVVAKHRSNQFQADGHRNLRAVMETGEIGREELREAVSLDGRLQTEMDEPRDLPLDREFRLVGGAAGVADAGCGHPGERTGKPPLGGPPR